MTLHLHDDGLIYFSEGGDRGCVNHPDRPVRTNLDGEDLCQECADNWARGEGQAAADADQQDAQP